MLKKIIILFLLTLELFSLTLKDTYLTSSKNIKLRDIFPDASYDVTLYKIDPSHHTKKIKSHELLKLLTKHGYDSLETSSRYIRFVQKSPISTLKIKNFIQTSFLENHPKIKIHSIFVVPRGYIKSLPEKYDVTMPKRFYLSRKGTLSIKTLDHKKIFFDYLIDADLYVYITKYKSKKGEPLSSLNSSKKSIHLDKLKSLPVNIQQINTTQFKRNIKSNSIITMKDIETLNLVKKGSNVVVSLDENNINISFSAKALQSGKLRDIITVQKSNKQRLKVQIIGKNKVVIR